MTDVPKTTLRERCEALVREWLQEAADFEADGWFTAAQACEHNAIELQSALDATADEGRDAARYRFIRSCHDSKHKTVAVVCWGDEPWEPESGENLDAAIDDAMKEGKP